MMDMDEKMRRTVNKTRTADHGMCAVFILMVLAYAAYVITDYPNIHVDEVQV